MSMLIKGMEMPKNCLWCPLQYFGFCQVTKTDVNSDLGRRADDCPLVELPDKHGRLVDADELWKKMSKYTDNMGAKMPFGDDDSMIHRDSACFMIESADTIIEAEGWEE